MSFKSTVRGVVNSALDHIEGLDAEISTTEAKKDYYAKITYDAKMAELTSSRAGIIQDTNARIDREILEYKARVTEAYTPDGAQLHEDAKLLSSGMKLDKTDLQRLFDKHQGNPTMQRLIAEYADGHDISIGRHYVSEQEALDGAEKMRQYTQNALARSDYAAIFRDDAMFDKISAGIVEV